MKQFLKDYQFLIFAFVQIIWGGLVWWFRVNVATKKDLASVQHGLEGVGSRASALELAMRGAPDRQDIALLHLEMERTRGQMSTFTAEVRGAQRTIEAQLDGARDLTSRVESTAKLLLEHALREDK